MDIIDLQDGHATPKFWVLVNLLYLKFSCLYLFPFSHKVVPQKASGGSGGGGRIPHFNWSIYLSQNAKRASARKDTGLDQSLFSVQLFRLRINIIKVRKGANKGHFGGLDKVF